MPEYKVPLRDMRFLLHEVFDVASHYEAAGFEDVGADIVDAILSEGAKFCEDFVAPINAVGDSEGSHLVDGKVTTPKGWQTAIDAYREGGWGAVGSNPEYGGQGLPESLELLFNEMAVASNMAWRLCTSLTLGAIHAIDAHASDELKQRFLPKLISLEWTGTMCLTEPHAGSDLGILSTSAVPSDDGSYAISGTKIFITYGEHDLADNIVHLVLARLPDAPAGPKGISLFIVPKFVPDADGKPGERNPVVCSAIEEKHGIHGSPTAVLNFEGAKGYLVGAPNRGLSCMFTMMNFARIDVGTHGLGQAERSLQGAVAYARDRTQFRAPGGAVAPDQKADPIIVHPDVRRMLLTQKAIAEGCRALSTFASMQLDVEHHHPDEDARSKGGDMLAFLIPITKAFLTESGYEAAYWGVQVLGGAGYIKESGMEQYMRDARIASIYEGTNGIQANDLLRRKVIGSGGAMLRDFIALIDAECETARGVEGLGTFVEALSEQSKQWGQLAESLSTRAGEDPAVVGAASFDFMMLSGYVVVAYFWLRMARVAQQKLDAGAGDETFYRAKLMTARFYYERILPRTLTLAATLGASTDSLMDMPDDAFVI